MRLTAKACVNARPHESLYRHMGQSDARSMPVNRLLMGDSPHHRLSPVTSKPVNCEEPFLRDVDQVVGVQVRIPDQTTVDVDGVCPAESGELNPVDSFRQGLYRGNREFTPSGLIDPDGQLPSRYSQPLPGHVPEPQPLSGSSKLP